MDASQIIDEVSIKKEPDDVQSDIPRTNTKHEQGSTLSEISEGVSLEAAPIFQNKQKDFCLQGTDPVGRRINGPTAQNDSQDATPVNLSLRTSESVNPSSNSCLSTSSSEPINLVNNTSEPINLVNNIVLPSSGNIDQTQYGNKNGVAVSLEESEKKCNSDENNEETSQCQPNLVSQPMEIQDCSPAEPDPIHSDELLISSSGNSQATDQKIRPEDPDEDEESHPNTPLASSAGVHSLRIGRKVGERTSKRTIQTRSSSGSLPKTCKIHNAPETMLLQGLGVKKYNCTVCYESFLQKGQLRKHFSEAHEGMSDDDDDPEKQSLIKYVCPICGMTLNKKYAMKRHFERKHSEVKIIPCLECNFKSKDLYLYLKHTEIHNPRSIDYLPLAKTPSGKWQLMCYECHQKFESRVALKLHARNHKAASSLKQAFPSKGRLSKSCICFSYEGASDGSSNKTCGLHSQSHLLASGLEISPERSFLYLLPLELRSIVGNTLCIMATCTARLEMLMRSLKVVRPPEPSSANSRNEKNPPSLQNTLATVKQISHLSTELTSLTTTLENILKSKELTKGEDDLKECLGNSNSDIVELPSDGDDDASALKECLGNSNSDIFTVEMPSDGDDEEDLKQCLGNSDIVELPSDENDDACESAILEEICEPIELDVCEESFQNEDIKIETVDGIDEWDDSVHAIERGDNLVLKIERVATTDRRTSNDNTVNTLDRASSKTNRSLRKRCQSKSTSSQTTTKTRIRAKAIKVNLALLASHPPGTLTCKECGKTYAAFAGLKRHLMVHENVRPHQCTLCPLSFGRNEHLKRHMIKHTLERPFKCESHNCDYAAKTAKDLHKHTLTHEERRIIPCTKCSYLGRTRYELTLHEKKHDPCNLCGHIASDNADYRQHKRTHVSYACTQCSYVSHTSWQLQKHSEKHKVGEDGAARFSCELCGYTCQRKTQLSYHMARHKNDKPFSCKDCDYKCSSRSSLISHKLMHAGLKPFLCSICGGSYRRTSTLRNHMLVHKEEKKYACRFCNRPFRSSFNMRQHEMIHTGEKQFKCHVCNFACRRNKDFRTHMKKHNESDQTPPEEMEVEDPSKATKATVATS